MKDTEATKERFLVMISTLDKLSDRDSSIVIASYIEEYLSHILLVITKIYPDAIDLLLFRRLDSLSAKISAIRSSDIVGITGELLKVSVVDDMEIIRKIRNEFAHKSEELSFTHNDIKVRCGNLKEADAGPDPPTDPRERFMVSSLRVLLELYSVAKKKEEEYRYKLAK